MASGGEQDTNPYLETSEEDDSITDMLYKSGKHKPTQGYTESWD